MIAVMIILYNHNNGYNNSNDDNNGYNNTI